MRLIDQLAQLQKFYDEGADQEVGFRYQIELPDGAEEGYWEAETKYEVSEIEAHGGYVTIHLA